MTTRIQSVSSARRVPTVLSFVVVIAMSIAARPASAAIAIDATTFKDSSTASATIATPAFSTTSGNELLLAFIATDYVSGTNTTVTNVTGAGLTWVLVRRTNAQSGTAEIWRAFAPAALTSVSVTATLSQAVATSLTVVSFTGTDTSGTNGSGAIGATAAGSAASGAPTATLVTTRANSWVFGVGNDYDNPIARTPGAGQTVVHQYLATIGDTYWVQRQNSPTPSSGTSVTINDTAPTADRYNLSICEILPPSAPSSDTTPPSVSISAPADGATVSGTTTVSANASDNVGVVGVQFQIDGAPLGAEVTAAPYSVAWNTASTTDGPHALTAVARDAAGNATTSPAVGVAVSNGATIGQWSAPFDVGLVAVNMVMLHTGRVLMYSGTYATSGAERVWDPATGSLTLVPNSYYNVFCSGQAQLPDGRILVVGGYDPPSLGAANANIFDPVTQTWSAVSNMAYRRWYPTATTLPDGRILVTSGAQSCLTCLADLPEIFDPATGQFTTLSSARLGAPYYPFMFVLPDGKIIDAGANEEQFATWKLDVAAGTWTSVDSNVRDGHSAAMYQPGKILKSGTAADSGTAGNAAATAFVLDTNQPSPAWRQVASMAFPRAFHNTTLLPDGTVLVTGGGTALDGYDVTKAVRDAELWSPATETWSTLARAAVPRLYHSTALLLPDARVLVAGSGNDGPAVNQTQAELFSPPYLFKGARPTFSGAPGVVEYGSSFTVQSPDAASVASVSLIRPGAVTHGFDEDQRFLSLGFTAVGGSVTIQAPPNANLAPPGYYMLFLVNTAGVPSVAAFVQLPATAADTEPPTPPAGLTAQGALGSATLTWTASTDNTGVALYNIHRSQTSGFQPTASTRVGQSTSTSFTDTGVAAGTYYYVATAQDVAGNVSAPSNEATAMVLADTTPPTVSITSPSDQATVSGSIQVSANASDDVGVVGVQFQLDGAALGAEQTTAPYRVTWNTTATSNGPHTISAIARDAAGNRSQASVGVNVSNTSSPPSGLVAAYGFSEGSGVQTRDASGQSNTATLSGATWTTAGRFGSALSFNGTSAWVTVADSASLDLTTGMTIEAWVRPTSGNGWRCVALKESAGGLAYALYSANNASRPSGYVHMAADIGVNGTAAVPLNTWTHLAVTYDGAALRMFVNGVQVSSRAVSGAMAATAAPFRIGGNSVWGEYFRGLIDEVRVYNRALSAGEIQTDMNTPVQ